MALNQPPASRVNRQATAARFTDKRTNHVGIVILGGEMQWGPTRMINAIGIGSRGEEPLNQSRITVNHGIGKLVTPGPVNAHTPD
jgi:hypothetical protein